MTLSLRRLAALVALAAALLAPHAAAAQLLLGVGSGGVAAVVYPINAIVGPTNALGFSGGNFCGSQQPACLEGAFAAWASGTPSVPSPDGGSALTFPVTQNGYTLTTGAGSNVAASSFSDTRYITSRVRWPYPNQGTLPASPTLSTAVVALDSFIYEPGTTVVPGTITNNSTLTSPKPLCNFTMESRTVAGNLFGGAAVPIEVTCWHRNARANEQIAGVVFTLTDQHSHSTSYTVAASSISAAVAADQAAVIVYAMPQVDTTGVLTDLDQITLSACAYPQVGLAASVACTADSAVLREFSPRYFLKDVGHAATPVRAYVCTTSGQGSCSANGNDATGVWTDVDATAKATPFATIKGAMDAIDAARNTAKTGSKADGLVMYIGSNGGSAYAFGSPTVTRNQTFACLTITNDPAVAKASAQVTLSAAFSPKLTGSNGSPDLEGCLRLVNLTMTRSTGQISGGSTNNTQIHFVGTDYDNGSIASPPLGSNTHLYWLGGTLTNASAGGMFGPSANFQTRIVRGVLAAGGTGMEMWLNLGNKVTGATQVQSGASRTANGSIVAFNYFLTFNSANDFYQIANGENITAGVVFAQNVVESTSSTISRVGVGLSRDAMSGSTANVIFAYNLLLGYRAANRDNNKYDDCVSGTCSFTRLHKLWLHAANIEGEVFSKGDAFVGGQGDTTNAPNRTGNFAFNYGADTWGNLQQYGLVGTDTIGDDRHQQYPGRKTLYGTVDSTPYMATSNFASYQGPSGGGDGAGGGTYTLNNGAPVIGIVPVGLLKYDLAGNTRKATADTPGPLCNASAGACN